MALEMKTSCQLCGSTLAPNGEACICSHECTFCPACAKEMNHICPNCKGELVPRPKRAVHADGQA